MNYLTSNIFNFILALILLFFSIMKLTEPELYYFRVVENGITGWFWGSFLVKVVILTEMSLVLFLLLNIIRKKLFVILFLFLTIVYSLDTIMGLGNDLVYSGNHSFLMFSEPIVQFSLLIAFLVLCYLTLKKEKSDLKFRWIKYIIPLPIAGLILALNPIYIDDYGIVDSEVKSPSLDWAILSENNDYSIDLSEKTLIAFFTPGCPHCNKASRVIDATVRGTKSTAKTIFIFPENKDAAALFIQRNKVVVPYYTISNADFAKLAGHAFPSFYRVNDLQEINHWTGSTFNFNEIDKIFK